MTGHQTEFTATINELENLVSSFSQYQEISQFEEVAGMVKSINTRLTSCHDQSKVFNNREMLTGNQATDYSQL
jgi:hypothetical protein